MSRKRGFSGIRVYSRLSEHFFGYINKFLDARMNSRPGDLFREEKFALLNTDIGSFW